MSRPSRSILRNVSVLTFSSRFVSLRVNTDSRRRRDASRLLWRAFVTSGSAPEAKAARRWLAPRRPGGRQLNLLAGVRTAPLFLTVAWAQVRPLYPWLRLSAAAWRDHDPSIAILQEQAGRRARPSGR